LGKTLKKFPILFGGGLGMLNIKPVGLEIIDGAKPYHERPFHVSPFCGHRLASLFAAAGVSKTRLIGKYRF
jgi:hypothetical protein